MMLIYGTEGNIFTVRDSRNWAKKIAATVKKGGCIGLIIIRLGGYERLVSQVGYAGSNAAHRQISKFLRQIIPGHQVYRLDSLHFGCIVEGGEDAAMEAAVRIEDRLSQKFNIPGYNDSVRIPFGIAVAECPGFINGKEEFKYLVKVLLPEPKEYDSEHIHRIREEDTKVFARRRAVEQAIERSIRSASFKVLYQPIIRVDEMSVYSVEALVRLDDPELGIIFPDEFIPIAEEMDVMPYITECVMNRAAGLMSLGGLMDRGVHRMHVNISASECLREGTAARLKAIATDNKLDDYVMCLELSEEASPGEHNAVGEGIVRLHDEGLAIVLDDYGTGYSNMTGIVALPIDLVKIDRSFLWMAMKDDKIMRMLVRIIDMIHDMGRKVLVTGIEDKECYDAVLNAGADYVQGYYMCKPVTDTELLEYVANVNKFGLSPIGKE